MIDESEIGLAVLHANTDQYCNPTKNTNLKETNLNVASQTLTDTCFKNNYQSWDTQQTNMNTESQESCVFQFENKAQDLFIISDTPEPVRKRTIDYHSFYETKKKSPPTETKAEKSFLVEKKSPQTETKAEKAFLMEKKSPLFEALVEEPFLMENKSPSIQNIDIKKEPEIKSEKKFLTLHSRRQETGLVYSKLNPPLSVKNNSQLNLSGTIQPSAQVVVKYEPLIPKNKSFLSYQNSNQEGKKNFKKFKKVPKAINMFSKMKKDNQSLFISFKQEEFNVNSQFEMFMKSNK